MPPGAQVCFDFPGLLRVLSPEGLSRVKNRTRETQTRHGAEIIWRHILTKRPIFKASKESDSRISPKEINNLPHSDQKRPFLWVPDAAGWVGWNAVIL